MSDSLPPPPHLGEPPDPPDGGAPLGVNRSSAEPDPPLDDRERTLHPRVVTAWRLGTAVGLLLPLGAVYFGVWQILPGFRVPLGALALLLWLGWSIWFPGVRFRRWRWRVSELALELRYGVLVHRHDALPYFRIQQIDIKQGPFERLLGLAELTVTTASASGSVALPGIAAEDAPRVRRELLRRAAEVLGDRADEARDAV